MPAGIEVINDNNIIQITEAFSNFALVTKGVGRLEKHWPTYGAGFQFYVTKTSPIPPMVALYSTGAPCFVAGVNDRGADWLFTVLCSNEDVFIGQNVEWYAFGQPSSVASVPVSGQVVFHVFRSDSTVLFDSGYKYMRVVDTYTAGSTALGYRNLGAGRKYGVVSVYPAFDFQLIPGGGGFLWNIFGSATMTRSDATGYNITYNNFYTQDYFDQPSNPGAGRFTMSYIAVDLTGL